MLEGTIVSVPVKLSGRGSQSEVFKVDTSNILFVCSGAFSGLDKIIKARVGDVSSSNVFDLVDPADFIKFGFIPEFIGRMPILSSSSPLTTADLVRILTEPKNSIISQFKAIFLAAGIKLEFHEESLVRIAELACVKKSGARGLRIVLESILQDAQYEYPGTDVKYLVVLPDCVDLNVPLAAFREGEERQVQLILELGNEMAPSIYCDISKEE
jgi:ATP-dependent Clp protease ATP-binding subunit ClpX